MVEAGLEAVASEVAVFVVVRSVVAEGRAHRHSDRAADIVAVAARSDRELVLVEGSAGPHFVVADVRYVHRDVRYAHRVMVVDGGHSHALNTGAQAVH